MHTLCLTRNTKSIQKRSEMYSWSETRELCLMSVFSHKGVDESGTCDDSFLQPIEENDRVIHLNGKDKFEVGTPEQRLFIVRDTTGKTVTYIVGYVDDLIVADR